MTITLRNILCTFLALCLLGLFLRTAETTFNPYSIQVLNLVAINAILAVSLNLIYGMTGMFSLGHAGFMAIGAYVCTIFILTPQQKETMWILEAIHPFLAHLTLPFSLAVLLAGFAAATIALVVAIPVLRLGGDYLGIATLGFAEIIRVLITNATPFTNGSLGIKGIPQYSTLWWNYGWLIVTIYFIVTLLRSNVGNVFRAIRDDEIASRTMGVNTFFFRVLSFCIGAFFAGIGGALLAALISTIDPKMFTFMLTFNILMIVVAGGLGSITGSVVGSVVITIMLEWLRPIDGTFTLTDLTGETFFQYIPIDGLAGMLNTVTIPSVPGMRMVIFSLLLMCIILFRRQGLLGTYEFSWDSVFSLPGRLARCFGMTRAQAGSHAGGAHE